MYSRTYTVEHIGGMLRFQQDSLMPQIKHLNVDFYSRNGYEFDSTFIDAIGYSEQDGILGIVIDNNVYAYVASLRNFTELVTATSVGTTYNTQTKRLIGAGAYDDMRPRVVEYVVELTAVDVEGVGITYTVQASSETEAVLVWANDFSDVMEDYQISGVSRAYDN